MMIVLTVYLLKLTQELPKIYQRFTQDIKIYRRFTQYLPKIYQNFLLGLSIFGCRHLMFAKDKKGGLR